MTAYWCAALPVLVLCIGLFNLLTWPRPRFRPGQLHVPLDASILIPARNEQANIEACVRAALATGVREVVVCDDDSHDRTPEILERLRVQDPRLTVIQAGPLPPGWVGKPHACHRLAKHASGAWLLFVDADVKLRPEAVLGLAELVHRFRSNVVTAFPEQVMVGWAERLVVPLLHLTYVSWLPLLLIPRLRTTRALAANGQLLLVDRATYDACDGFSAVRSAIVDDMAFCARSKSLGHTVLFAEGSRLASCRMYRSAREVWEGFSKNLFLGLGGRIHNLLLVMILYVLAFLAPLVLLILAPQSTAALTGCLAICALRIAIAARFRHPIGTVFTHPLALIAFVAIGINSLRWGLGNRVSWRGRVYPGSAAEGRS
ncbi:MAG: glycosyltransferase [Myxococcota bacterium]